MVLQSGDGFDETLIPIILDRIPAAVTLIDLDGNILYYNAYSSQILERKPELLGTDIRLCHQKPEGIARIDEMLESFKEGRRKEYVYETERFGRNIVVTLLPFVVEDRLLGCLQSVIIKP
jgi:DUF438 domain-containing protein